MASTADTMAPPSRRRQAPLIAGCLAVFAGLAVLLYLPAGPLDAHRLPGSGLGDLAQQAWFLGWWRFALGHGLSAVRLHTNYLNYPDGINLANNASMPLLGVLTAPVTAALGPVASLNLLLRLAFAASAASMFFVLRQWCRRWYVAFLGGLVYGFSPYVVGQASNHVFLAFVALPPLVVWCAYELVVERRRSAVRLGTLLGLLAGAQALIDPEVIVELAIVLAVGLIGLAVVQRDQLRASMRYLLIGIGVAGVVFVAIAADVLWWALFAKGHVHGTVQPVSHIQTFRSDLLTPIVPTHLQAIAPSALANRAAKFVNSNVTEQDGYLGLPLVGITLALVVAWRRKPAMRSSAALALVAFVLSLGSRLTIDAHVTAVPLPEAVFAHLPLLDNINPARFALEVVLFVVIAVAVGSDATLDWARTRPDRERRVVWGSAVALGTLTLASIAPALPLATGTVAWPSSVEAMLRTIPSGGVLLTYPYAINADSNQAMLWQARTGMRVRLIGGYATIESNSHAGFFPSLLEPASVPEILVSSGSGGLPATWIRVANRPATELCTFIKNYDVTAVLYWPGGKYPEPPLKYFETVLGPPTAQDHDVRLWFTDRTNCRTFVGTPAG